jgi:hexosaminidase
MHVRTIALTAALALVAGCATNAPQKPAAPSVTQTTSAKASTPSNAIDKLPLSLIPQPALLEPKRGTFELRNGAALVVDSQNAEAAAIARRFADLLAETRGIRLDVRPFGGGEPRDGIVFRLDARAANVPSGEGYDLAVDSHRVLLIARDPRGLFYGSVTLWQLLTQDIEKTARIEIPELHIADEPRFAWRGAMLDSARHFQSVAFVKRFIDQLALLKLNTLH